jgi:hypothetical protein
MIAMRDRQVRRLGVLCAVLALCVQLAFVGLGAPPSAVTEAPVDALGGHALCLAGESGKAPQPAGSAPVAPTHDHTLYCCLWHSLGSTAQQAAPTPLPVSYAAVAPVEPGGAALITAPRHKPANARAPPTLA